MINRLQVYWRRRKKVQQRKTALRYWQKHSAILQQGVPIYADVLDCYKSCITKAQLTLVHLRLSIPVKGKVAVETTSTAFVPCGSQALVSKRLRIRFLPTDLSHVVITG